MIITRVPCTLILLLISLNNFSYVYLLFITISIDLLLNLCFDFWDRINHYLLLTNDFRKRIDDSEEISDELIRRLNRERINVDSFYYKMASKVGVDIGVVVYRYIKEPPNVKILPSTLPNGSGKSIISMPSSYDSNDIKSVAKLAHEFGHTSHHLLRQEQMIVPASCSIFSIISVFLYVQGYLSVWIPCIFAFLTIIIIMKNKSQFITLIESNADLLAVQMIEKVFGFGYAQKVAEHLLALRIFSMRNPKGKSDKYIANNCIRNLSYLISDEKRAEIILKSVKRTKSLRDNNLMPHTEKRNCLSKELTLRYLLERAISVESSFYLRMSSTNAFDFLVLLTQIVAIVFGFTYYSFPGFSMVESMVIGLMLICLLIVIYFIISNLIWKKELKWMQVHGVM